MTRVAVEPALLQWAWRRSGLGASARAQRFPQLDAWERGERLPTVKQLEHFARASHVPFGALFLPQPPQEALPIADFRERSLGPASGELLDVIYAAQRRQAGRIALACEGVRPFVLNRGQGDRAASSTPSR